MRSRLRLLIMWVFRISSPSMFGTPSFSDVVRGSMRPRLQFFGISSTLYARPVPHGSVLFPEWVDWERVVR